MQNFKYAEPNSLEEALALLKQYGASAAMLAGGTDLINHIHLGKRSPSIVVQIRKIVEFGTRIEAQETGIKIGPLTTLSEITGAQLVQERFTALAEAAGKVGSKQIRNRATLVGNICNASPAADTVPALLVYNAVVHMVGRDGQRSLPLDEFITGPGKTVLKQGEIVESIFMAYSPVGSTATYHKLSRRDGVDLATVGVAAYADHEATIRLALGAVGPRAFRAYDAEKILCQSSFDDQTIKCGIKETVNAASPISDLRGSREYRLAMIETLTHRAIKAVLGKQE